MKRANARADRFRAPTDLPATGYLFPWHVAVLEGQAAFTRARVAYLTSVCGGIKALPLAHVGAGTDRAPFSICPNMSVQRGWRALSSNTNPIEFSVYYPDRSIYEV